MNNRNILWYDKPADDWNEALPIGNGTLGGMIFGRINSEIIQLNEDSVWYGGPQDRNNPDALKYLPEIRKLILEGNIDEAQKLSVFALSGTPETQRHYEPLGNLGLYFSYDEDKITNYKRQLDISNALSTVEYTMGDTDYKRECFVSYPSQAMVIKLSSSTPGKLNFHTQLSRGNVRHHDDPVSTRKNVYGGGFNAYVTNSYSFNNNISVMQANCGGAGSVELTSAIKVELTDGNVKTIGNSIIIENATEVYIYLTCSTSFREENHKDVCLKRLEHVSKVDYVALKEEHIKDYQRLFNRVDINIGNAKHNIYNQPTNVLLEQVKEGNVDNNLINLIYQYGRYLLISSSRPGSLPANLQGIWNKDMFPSWGSKYTININTEMNYWPAEVTNLSECHIPLFDHLNRMKKNGQITAKKMYGCRGFVAHHNTDIWADTAPQDIYLSSTYWVMGAAWLSLHLYEHYLFTLDKKFLENNYDTIREAALFIVDYLVEDNDGSLIICPTTSPENDYYLGDFKASLCKSAMMDNQIIFELFSACIDSSVILDTDASFRTQLKEALSKIKGLNIGKHGQIMEWSEDYDEVEPGHRHISQLFALHPGTQISPVSTPKFAEAAKKTLILRISNGGGHTGWSRAWIINMWARLEDGTQSYHNIVELLRTSTLPNLLDNHPPFQIDGNFGSIAGITEMLLQSHNNEISLLPAVPKEWNIGYIKGVKARGGYTLDIVWNLDKNIELTLHTTNKDTVKIRYKSDIRTLEHSENQKYNIFFNTKRK